MGEHSAAIHIQTQGFSDMHDLTPMAESFLETSSVTNGIFCAFVPGATAALTTIEYEEGALRDLRGAIERLAPQNIRYEHDSRWGDGNGFSHVRAALLGPSLAVPVAGGKLRLGTWQQIILVDFDNRPRNREVIFGIVGE